MTIAKKIHLMKRREDRYMDRVLNEDPMSRTEEEVAHMMNFYDTEIRKLEAEELAADLAARMMIIESIA